MNQYAIVTKDHVKCMYQTIDHIISQEDYLSDFNDEELGQIINQTYTGLTDGKSFFFY